MLSLNLLNNFVPRKSQHNVSVAFYLHFKTFLGGDKINTQHKAELPDISSCNAYNIPGNGYSSLKPTVTGTT